jgi:tetratricopeptide (TPR) repeat protein
VPNAARMLALFSLGRLYRQEGDLPTALRAFEQALALKPQESTMLASLHFYVGTLLPKVRGLEVDVLSSAIDHFTQALALKPEWAANVLYNRGTMYLGRGLLSLDERADLDAAVTDLTEVVERQPQGVVPLLNRGIAYYQRRGKGDLAAAITDFSQVIAFAPEDYRGYYHRGLAKIRAGAEGWSEDLLKAKALNPQDPSSDNGLCWGYALDGESQTALPYCEAAVATDPTGSSFDGRAIVYSDLGRTPDAVSDLKQYILWVQSEHPELYAKYHGPDAESWIAALEAGENPFTFEVRAALR